MANEIHVETYGCHCGYSLEIEQSPDQPRIHPLTEAFYIRRGWTQRGLSVGKCPNCFRKRQNNGGALARIIDPDLQSVMEVKGVEEVEEQTAVVLDQYGFPIREQVGVEEKKFIQGDEIVTEEIPIMAVKTRGLTEEEKQAEIARIREAEDRAVAMSSRAA